MVTRREVLILGLASPWLTASGAPEPAPRPDRGPYGRQIASWSRLDKPAGSSVLMSNDAPPGTGAGAVLRLNQDAALSSAEQRPIDGGPYQPQDAAGFTVGVWVKNPNSRSLNFVLGVYNANASAYVKWNCAVEPGDSWAFLTLSHSQQIAAGWKPGADAIHAVRISQQDNAAEGPWHPGEYLLFGNVYADLPGRPLFMLTFDDGFASQRHPNAERTPRSAQQIVESYGFRGSLFLVPTWLGTTGVYGYGGGANKFLSVEDAKAMHAAGWSIGSHSNTHPSSADNAGLRLLGPYGYFLSNTVDNLPPAYVTTWGLGPTHRRRAIRAAAGTNVVTFENPHQFLVNFPIVFADRAPSGLQVGTTYYCQSIPSPASATFATDQGSLKATAAISADWSGLANYRYAGASNDDRAIHADIQAGIAGITAIGIPTGARYFSLPQGSADAYVRSACIRARLPWVRGASLHGHTLLVGRPSGGGLSNVANTPGGWLAQPDCIQTDGAVNPSIAAIKAYVDETIRERACGCSYHHEVAGSTTANLENLCAHLRQKADAKLIEVVTLDQMWALQNRKPAIPQ